MYRLLRMVLIVVVISMPSVVMARNVNLSWDTPLIKCDGTALTNLTGYRMWWGESPRPTGDLMPGIPMAHEIPACDTAVFTQYSYPNTQALGNVNSLVLDVGMSGLERTFYFAISVVNPDGESTYSNEIIVTVPPTMAPSLPPTNLTGVVD